MTTTTVSLTPETLIATEGETFAWNFSLDQPAPEGGLSLFLPITVNDDPAPGDVEYNIEGSENISDFEFVVNNDLSVGFNNDPAPGDVEYNVDGSSGIAEFEFIAEDGVSESFNITIAEGETEAVLVSQAIADDLEEGDEIFTTILNDGENYRADPLSREVVTTIVESDSSSPPVVNVTAKPTIFAENGGMGSFIITLSEPAPEEGLKIEFEAFDEDGMQGDSEIALENISDIEIITFGNNPSFIIVEPGATEAKVMFIGIPDSVPEREEISAFTILEAEGYTIDSNQSSANIIITDLPIVSLNAEPTNVNEGEQLEFNFNLTEPVGEGGLVVNLDLVEDTDPLPGDINYFVEGSENVTDFELLINEESGLIDGAKVTLAEGATSATLLSDIIADNATEGEESVTFGLAESKEYSIDSEVNAASFTILDTSTDLDTSTSTSISFELDDLSVPARGVVVDVTFDLDYVSGIEDSEFLEVGAIADSIENYLANNPGDGDFFEVITEDLGEFLVSDSGLGIGEVAESITVELDVEPNSVIPFPFSVTSTVEIAEI